MIAHLTIIGESYLGLFGQLAHGAVVKNLGVVGVNVTGSGHDIGGLVGNNRTWYHVGRTELFRMGGVLNSCYSVGAVSGSSRVGGLVGFSCGTVTQCYSMGTVRGISCVGGLVGDNGHERLRDQHGGPGIITCCYSTSTAIGDSSVGGLAGHNGGYVVHCYTIGSVSGAEGVGGLVGSGGAEAFSSFWDIETSGQTTSAGGTGKTTAEMQTASTFLDAMWDFADETANGTEDIWRILEGKDYPHLWWEATEE